KAIEDDLARAFNRNGTLLSDLKIQQISIQDMTQTNENLKKELMKSQIETSELRSEWDEEKKRWDERLAAHKQNEMQLETQLIDLERTFNSAKGEHQMAIIRNSTLQTDLENSQTSVQELEYKTKDLSERLLESESAATIL